jgi:hypothetical protein
MNLNLKPQGGRRFAERNGATRSEGLDVGKYFWHSGGEKCFSLDIPLYRTSGPNIFRMPVTRAKDYSYLKETIGSTCIARRAGM